MQQFKKMTVLQKVIIIFFSLSLPIGGLFLRVNRPIEVVLICNCYQNDYVYVDEKIEEKEEDIELYVPDECIFGECIEDENDIVAEEEDEVEDEDEVVIEPQTPIISTPSTPVVNTPRPPSPPRVPTNVSSITNEERTLLASILWLEARGEDRRGQIMVIEVIFNRLHSGQWGNNLHSVIFAPNQFSPANRIGTFTPGQTQFDIVDEVIREGVRFLPPYVLYFRSIRAHSWAGHQLYVRHGVHFFSFNISDRNRLANRPPVVETPSIPNEYEPIVEDEKEEVPYEDTPCDVPYEGDDKTIKKEYEEVVKDEQPIFEL